MGRAKRQSTHFRDRLRAQRRQERIEVIESIMGLLVVVSMILLACFSVSLYFPTK